MIGMTGFDPTDPRVQLEVVSERLKNTEEKIRQLEGNLAQAYTNLGRKESELNLLRDEHVDLVVKWEVAKRDLRHTQETLKLSSQRNIKKQNSVRRRTISTNVLYFLAAVFTGFGTSMLTSTPPNLLGWMMIAFAAVVYFVGAISIVTEGRDE